ncbi:MAG: DUF6249 domain-containing protein [Gammaproteobacteria bacterium]|nr:DUF6249 domain-containing protein [Gammaproteobacteria bacterium]
MEDLGLGVGLAAIAFWGFVACTVFAAVWNGIRKRDAEHETVRRLMESGQPIDDALLEKLSLASNAGSKRPDKEFYVTALWLLPISAGLAVFAVILGTQEPEARVPLLGAAGLCGCLGIGWLVAAKIARSWLVEDGDSAG